MKYSKLPITIAEQIEKKKSQELRFNNEANTESYLSHISYYRLRSYTYPFQDNTNTDQPFNVESISV